MKVSVNDISKLDEAIRTLEARTDQPDRAETLSMLRAARKQAERALGTPLGITSAVLSSDELALSLAMSAMSGSAPPTPDAASEQLVSPRQYADLDPGWLQSFFHYLRSKRLPFPTHDAGVPAGQPGSGVIHVANDITLALAGDWGTGNTSSRAIARHIASLAPRPNYTIHLGDVYYSGTLDEEQERFVALWPSGADGAFALNSNHEMYSGGVGYFHVALEDPKFSLQRGLSYFALENASWIVFGLDSAYGSDACLYQKGELNPVQIAFLAVHGERARAAHKRVVVLTHHQPIEFDGSLVTPLCDQITSAVGVREIYWYWGHIHGAAVLEPKVVQGVTIHGRCIGHGGVPYEPLHLTPALTWAEDRLAGDPEEKRRALNGFAVVQLEGATIRESFLGEDGQLRYTTATAAAA
ncbi:metallophosphoesterase family protein [Polyangium mundeleinium]|uniref:Metallophosphoesterase n=1 Tax=Polyangium mundeleinium TaxID=2995306 RepID=A0ABT5ETM6_9BACT|nr:metallophosphoesterase [Polyangium mundeleinium]MDC0744804.1 metallophosphoesterase [Polyangium mundeleinium]